MKSSFILLSGTAVICAVILALGMGRIGSQNRTVTVRGLSERELDADLVVWPISFNAGSSELLPLQQDLLSKTDSVLEFLNEHGLSGDDISVQAPDIKDNSVNPYLDQERVSYRYIAQANILVRSGKIAQVKKAHDDSLSLASSGIALRQEYDSKMSFEFTKLNEIKPEMIAEATKNARLAAEQFAHDSGSKVGKIKTAAQGLFSIENLAAGLEERKRVRVVTTVEYLLK